MNFEKKKGWLLRFRVCITPNIFDTRARSLCLNLIEKTVYEIMVSWCSSRIVIKFSTWNYTQSKPFD